MYSSNQEGVAVSTNSLEQFAPTNLKSPKLPCAMHLVHVALRVRAVAHCCANREL